MMTGTVMIVGRRIHREDLVFDAKGGLAPRFHLGGVGERKADLAKARES